MKRLAIAAALVAVSVVPVSAQGLTQRHREMLAAAVRSGDPALMATTRWLIETETGRSAAPSGPLPQPWIGTPYPNGQTFWSDGTRSVVCTRMANGQTFCN